MHHQEVAAELVADDDAETMSVGVIDKTNCQKRGLTLGMQYQYLGYVGKTGKGIVTLQIGVAKASLPDVLTSHLYLTQS